MSHFTRKNNGFKKFFYSWPFLIFFVLALIYFIYNIIGLISKASMTAKNRDLSAEKRDMLLEQKNSLESEISKLKTQEGLETEIRNKFRVTKEGESLVVLVKEDEESDEINKKSSGFLSFIKNMFK